MRFDEIDFDDGILRRNFLDLPTGLSSLEIMDSNIEWIQNGVFQSQSYRQVASLKLKRLQIKYLDAGTFTGLTALETLELKKLILESVAGEVMAPIARTLRTFSLLFNQVPFDPSNFTSNLAELKVMTLQHNNFGSFINGQTFRNLLLLTNLTLNDNNIDQLANDTFNNVGSHIKALRLDETS